MRKLNLVALFLLLLTLPTIGPACAGPTATESPRTGDAPTAAAEPAFPDFVYNSAQALQAYKLAVKEKDVLHLIPCYCDCGRASKHTSLKDCYYKSDGSFNDHASNCDVCELEIIEVSEWRGQGKDIRQIRTMIDEKYRDWGQPTDTPPIE